MMLLLLLLLLKHLLKPRYYQKLGVSRWVGGCVTYAASALGMQASLLACLLVHGMHRFTLVYIYIYHQPPNCKTAANNSNLFDGPWRLLRFDHGQNHQLDKHNNSNHRNNSGNGDNSNNSNVSKSTAQMISLWMSVCFGPCNLVSTVVF